MATHRREGRSADCHVRRGVVERDGDPVRDAAAGLVDGDDIAGRHEADCDQPWAVTDAPEKYVAGQLRAIVGVRWT
ncbi:FMN-binding negative transcriptional regulator [Microbacterium kribbense]|uniref:FMN-binding negative transcriptional regulator n=1 Tax=Microbacterium kribbense TaxID=433645 RepID=UPI003CD06AA2